MSWQTGDVIEDQAGNQYHLRIDQTHQYITGKVNPHRGGQGGKYDILGSYVQMSSKGDWFYEITAVRSAGGNYREAIQA